MKFTTKESVKERDETALIMRRTEPKLCRRAMLPTSASPLPSLPNPRYCPPPWESFDFGAQQHRRNESVLHLNGNCGDFGDGGNGGDFVAIVLRRRCHKQADDALTEAAGAAIAVAVAVAVPLLQVGHWGNNQRTTATKKTATKTNETHTTQRALCLATRTSAALTSQRVMQRILRCTFSVFHLLSMPLAVSSRRSEINQEGRKTYRRSATERKVWGTNRATNKENDRKE